jgi:uncharacterized protein YacL
LGVGLMSTPPPNPDLHPFEAAQRQRVMLIRLVRTAFFVLTVTFTLLTILRPPRDSLSFDLAEHGWIPVLVAITLFGIALGIDILTPRKKIATLVGVTVGVLVGMLATLAISFLVELVMRMWMEPKVIEALEPVVKPLKILVGIALCYLGVTTILQTQDDFRLVIPYIEFAKQIRGARPVLVDTSVLIDGRIADLAATGFLQSPLIIPRAVVAELQLLADQSDAIQRNKGRRGLDLIARLQRAPKLDVTIDETPVQSKSVDQALVELARTMGALVMTADSGLARVAGIHGVGVLNLHDLANAMKTAAVAGEVLTVKLLRAGEQPGQAVGFLADGTMIVAEDGAEHIGQTVRATVTSSLQTSAGRLIFARINPIEVGPQPGPPAAVPTPTETPATSTADAVDLAPPPEPGQPARAARSPFPPKPPATIRAGSPRNPRR